MSEFKRVCTALKGVCRTRQTRLWIYVVGSAALKSEKRKIFDIDLLIVDPSSRSRKQLLSLECFRDSLVAGSPEQGSFHIRNVEAEALLSRMAIRLCRTLRRSVSIHAVVGPIGSMDIVGTETTLHSAGPFSKRELNGYFSLVPFHGFCFLARNVRINGPPLEGIAPRPRGSLKILRQFTRGQLKRASRLGTDVGIQRCLRKACLNVAGYIQPDSPYEEAAEIEKMLQNGGALINRLRLLSDYVLRSSGRSSLTASLQSRLVPPRRS